MNWISMVGFAAIGQCFLMASKYAIGKNSQQQKLLILLFVSLGFYELHEVLVQSQLMIEYTFLLSWGPLFPLLIAPLLFLYVQSILHSDFRFQKAHLLHLVPFLIAFFSRIDLILESSEKKADRLRSVFEKHTYPETDQFHPFDLGDLTHFLLWHLQPIVYFILVVLIVIKARDRIYGTNKLANWLKVLAFGMLLYFVGDYLAEIFLPGMVGRRRLIIEIPVFSFYIYALCLLVLQMSSAHPVNSISKDTMLKQEIERNFLRVQKLLIEKKLYLKPELQLAGLADELGLPGRDLSLVIKKSSGLSYTDFINKFRVEYSLELMKHPKYQAYTISSIGEASGFKSKDSFYRAFKKVIGLTPKAYQETYIES